MVTSKKKQINIHPGDVILIFLISIKENYKNFEDFPRLYRFFESDSVTSGREKRLERDLKVLQNKHSGIL